MTGPPGGDPTDPADLVLDCLGRPCPVPVVELARALQRLPAGSVVEVVSDDPAALVDVPAFCRMRGHHYLGSQPRAAGTALRARSTPRTST